MSYNSDAMLFNGVVVALVGKGIMTKLEVRCVGTITALWPCNGMT